MVALKSGAAWPRSRRGRVMVALLITLSGAGASGCGGSNASARPEAPTAGARAAAGPVASARAAGPNADRKTPEVATHLPTGVASADVHQSASEPLMQAFSALRVPVGGDYVASGRVKGLGDSYGPPAQVRLALLQDNGGGFVFQGRDARGYFLLLFNTPREGELLELSLTVPGDDEGKTTTTLPLRFASALPFLQSDGAAVRTKSTNGALDASLVRESQSVWHLQAVPVKNHAAPKYAISQLDAHISIETPSGDPGNWRRFSVSFTGRVSQAPGKFSGQLTFNRKDDK